MMWLAEQLRRSAATLRAQAEELDATAIEIDRAGGETLVSRHNCAAYGFVSWRAFRAAASNGAFPAFRMGRRPVALAADVLAWRGSRRIVPRMPNIAANDDAALYDAMTESPQ